MNIKPTLFAHLQDFVSCYVGPFDAREALDTHVKWCKEVRGDSAELMEVVEALPAGAFTMTPEADKNGTDGDSGLGNDCV